MVQEPVDVVQVRAGGEVHGDGATYAFWPATTRAVAAAATSATCLNFMVGCGEVSG